MTTPIVKVFRRYTISLAILGVGLMLAAGTVHYWQAWLLLAVVSLACVPHTVLIGQDPLLRESRLRSGPTAESRPIQKIIVTFLLATTVAAYLVPALDRRFGWSAVPLWLCLLGEGVILLALWWGYRVFRVNSFGAATVQVAENQRVIDSGPYATVRHPMYSGASIYTLGLSLALGSWWGLIPAALTVLGFAWRLADEEKFLARQLPGYADYCAKVRWRLFPGVY
ncbi:methyltransferase family protein [Paludibacterium purpuratum]|uniref:Protein-S-isoprenylcysteine O-methyltransferase Ste14 n=1 Tax=Paludibacterium purpuratum TaxID=1144873 RepID=A0A4R7B0N9_9NEIS|nr:isoprenylcysteine carboxylmethyltransferase family protein [Paludibacterium purpuratum]TDR76439.1 protein-S-isoprenylcysteine O-methyltransferase Ste14 [Paludibacterium purpuratum]